MITVTITSKTKTGSSFAVREDGLLVKTGTIQPSDGTQDWKDVLILLGRAIEEQYSTINASDEIPCERSD